MTYSNKNATYLSAYTVSQFLKCISDWMLNQTLSSIESVTTQQQLCWRSHQMEVIGWNCLIAQMVRDGTIENHFLEHNNIYLEEIRPQF